MPRTAKQFEDIRTDRKKSILDAALHIFSEEGYHNTSISKISKEAGVSKGLMYNYFESKEALLQILIGSLFDDEMNDMRKILEQAVSEESMIEFIKIGTKILKSKPKEWKLYFSMSTQPEVLKIIQDKFSNDHILFSEKLLEFFKMKKHKDPQLSLIYFGTALAGKKVSYITDPDNYPIDKIEELIIKQFITS
jgi:AcrR family transcriptional regulator